RGFDGRVVSGAETHAETQASAGAAAPSTPLRPASTRCCQRQLWTRLPSDTPESLGGGRWPLHAVLAPLPAAGNPARQFGAVGPRDRPALHVPRLRPSPRLCLPVSSHARNPTSAVRLFPRGGF